MATASINWQKNYTAIFGDISDRRARAWEEYVEHNVKNLKDDEMNNAVAWLCDNWTGDDRNKPTCHNIVTIIYKLRPKSAWRPVGKRDGIIQSLKSEIRTWVYAAQNNPQEPTLWNEVWNRLCDGINEVECNELERFAAMIAGHRDKYGQYSFNRDLVPDIKLMIADWRNFDATKILKNVADENRQKVTAAEAIQGMWKGRDISEDGLS